MLKQYTIYPRSLKVNNNLSELEKDFKELKDREFRKKEKNK